MKSSTSWRKIQRQSFTDWEKLADFLLLNPQQKQSILHHSSFPLLMPRRLAEKVKKGTLDDPILRQFLPLNEENIIAKDFVPDPVGDKPSQITPRLLKKYYGRAMLLCTSACAMHCRYCFRKHFNWADRDLSEELAQISKDKTLKEIILSGGDPLSLSNRELQNILSRLSKIPHIRRIRLHTRFPIGIPERIDHAFLDLIARTPQQIWMVLHINHPRELDDDVIAALDKVRMLGTPLLNQSVLLRGINDDAETFVELCETLADHGIQPYYLHQLDRVQGSAHFEVNVNEGRSLIKLAAKRLSGYALPRYVKEVPEMPGKVSIHP